MVDAVAKPKIRKPSPEEVAIKNSNVFKYTFRNIEQPGNCLRMNYGPKFKVEIDDGQIIDLPECVAEWINSLEVPQYKRTTDKAGVPRSVRLPTGLIRFILTRVREPVPQSQAPPTTEDTDNEESK